MKESIEGMEAAESWEEAREKLRQQLNDLPERQFPIYHSEATLRITLATPEQVVQVHAVMVEAFRSVQDLDPPSGALTETLAEAEEGMRHGGALLGWIGEEAVASARFLLEADYLYIGRLAVHPDYQGRGIASALMVLLEAIARLTGRPRLRLGTRMRMEKNVALYRRLGYKIVEQHRHPRGSDIVVWLEKATPLEEDADPSPWNQGT
ncbi:MAG: Acetyltransferase [Chthonomonadales bacterium]|nr:Acetyltransferase [Chthonomonadales bacterium]